MYLYDTKQRDASLRPNCVGNTSIFGLSGLFFCLCLCSFSDRNSKNSLMTDDNDGDGKSTE